MVLVLFQEQAIYKAPTPEIIPRVPDKSIVMSNEIESPIKIYPVPKPTVRSETPKTVNAFEKLRILSVPVCLITTLLWKGPVTKWI